MPYCILRFKPTLTTRSRTLGLRSSCMKSTIDSKSKGPGKTLSRKSTLKENKRCEMEDHVPFDLSRESLICLSVLAELQSTDSGTRRCTRRSTDIHTRCSRASTESTANVSEKRRIESTRRKRVHGLTMIRRFVQWMQRAAFVICERP